MKDADSIDDFFGMDEAGGRARADPSFDAKIAALHRHIAIAYRHHIDQAAASSFA